MTFTDSARALLKRLEGCRLTAYRCSAGRWTIGYGHTGDVAPGQVISQHQAEVILDHDLQRFVAGVEQLVASAPVPATDNQFSALVIFAFNVGLPALAGSTALRDLLQGRMQDVPLELSRWNKIHDASGVAVVNAGLIARRNAEIALWRTAS